MDDALLLLDRVATPGEVIATEPVYALTERAIAYLAQHAAVGADARG